MRHIWRIIITVCLLSLAGSGRIKTDRLFDGKSFNGWEGNMSVFRIEEGAIVAGSMKSSLKRNEFLCTTKEFSDFELRVKFKLLGDPQWANAGVQFRSRRIPESNEVKGYQADMGQKYWGALYDEGRRWKVLAAPNPEDMSRIIKPDDWNEYVIRAEGKHIRLTLNGHQTVDYTESDETIEQNGCVCVQIHSGPASEAWYKDIAIEPLSKMK
jgi:hypothetical protein